MKLTLIILSLIPLVYPKIESCGEGKGKLPKSVTLVNCDNTEDCDFVRGKSIIGDIEFDAQSDITSLIPLIYMTLGKDRGTKAITDMPDDRFFGCEWLVDGYSCPAVKGKTLKWRLNLPISSMEVTKPGSIEISMRSQDNSTQFCLIIWGTVYPL